MVRRIPTALAVGMLFAAWSAEAQIILPGQSGGAPSAPGASEPAPVCFVRRYDAAHLAAHPAQTVTAMALRLRSPRAEGPGRDPNRYDFSLAVERRGRRQRLTTSGECSARSGTIVCGVECDGGGFGLTRESSESVLVDLTRFGRLRLGRACDDDDGVEIVPGRDDRRFRLEAAEPARCAGLHD